MFSATHNAILGILAAIVAAGGTYGGYHVYKTGQYDSQVREGAPYFVARVIDGDTFVIAPEKEGGDEVKVRMLGIDAPEKGDCYYDASKMMLEQLIEGKYVYLQRDSTGADRYGRLLRYVILKAQSAEDSDELVNESMLRMGYAFTFNSSHDKLHRDLFASAQQEAQEHERGLWSADCEYTAERASDLREKSSEPPSAECTIKGNISEKGYGKLYFLEGCPNYSRIKVDTRKGESWFCSEAEAQKAGFTKSASCANTF